MTLNTLGIDISHWQPLVDPKQIDPSVKIFVLKISQGLFADPSFVTNGKILYAAGKILAGYVWPNPMMSPEKNIDEAVACIKAAGLPLSAIFLDTEQQLTDQKVLIAPEKLSEFAHGCWLFAKSAWSKVGEYVNRSWMIDYTTDKVKGINYMAQWLAAVKAPLWLPEYRHQPPVATPMTWPDFKKTWLPTYFPTLPVNCTIDQVVGHQFTGDKVQLPGIFANPANHTLSPLDVNMFDPAFFGVVPTNTPTVIPTPTAVPALPKYKCTAAVLNVRSGPGATFPIVRTIKLGTIVEVVTVQNSFYQLAGGGWASTWYLTRI